MSPIRDTIPMRYMGIDIVSAPHAVTLEQDWSGCRSPSRAKRRHARGIRTRMVETWKPACFAFDGRLYAHPALIAELQKVRADQMSRLASGDLYKSSIKPMVSDDVTRDLAKTWRPGGLLGIRWDVP